MRRVNHFSFCNPWSWPWFIIQLCTKHNTCCRWFTNVHNILAAVRVFIFLFLLSLFRFSWIQTRRVKWMMSLLECFGMYVIRRILGKTYITLYFSYTNFRNDFLNDMNFFLTVSLYEQGCQILNLEHQSLKVVFSKKNLVNVPT